MQAFSVISHEKYPRWRHFAISRDASESPDAVAADYGALQATPLRVAKALPKKLYLSCIVSESC